MNFFERAGLVSVGSRIRSMAETLTKDDRAIYLDYGLDFKPKWYPVAMVLLERDGRTITAIAEDIRQTHPSVSVLVKDMANHGLVATCACEGDARKTLVRLTEKGRSTMAKVQVISDQVKAAVEEIVSECQSDLWSALDQWEAALERQSLAQRVKKIRKTISNT